MVIEDISLTLWLVLIFSAFLTGMSKTGVFGLGTLVAPILASAVGGKISAGLLLPMLSMADIMAVLYYNRHASWSHLWRLFPFAALGVVVAIWVGEVVNDNIFKLIMAIFILGSIPIMVIREQIKDIKPLQGNWWWGGLFGIGGGFSTMIGNAAGPIMNLYLLAMHLPKNVLIGTGAWFFLVINLFKIPFHIFVWETITLQTISLNLLMLPVITAGAFLGIKVVKLLPEKPFRWLIISMTILASARLIYTIL